MTNNATRLLTEASLLPALMPANFTFNKVRELLEGLDASASAEELPAAIVAVKRQQIRSPLAVVIFIKHHLEGAHEVEIDRIEEGEEGARFAVLVYAEGEVPVDVEHLPQAAAQGSHVRYDPATGQYS